MSIYAISCTYLCQKNAFDRSCTHRNSFFRSFFCHKLARISVATNLSMYHIVIIFIVAWVATVADTRGQSFIKAKEGRKREKNAIKISTAILCHIFYYHYTVCADVTIMYHIFLSSLYMFYCTLKERRLKTHTEKHYPSFKIPK